MQTSALKAGRPAGFQMSAEERERRARGRRGNLRVRKTPPRRKLVAAPGEDRDRLWDIGDPPAPERHYTAEQILWCAVLQRAAIDALGPPGRVSREARAWLVEDPDFLLVADYAGIEDPANMREILRRYLPAPAKPADNVVPLRETILTGSVWPPTSIAA